MLAVARIGLALASMALVLLGVEAYLRLTAGQPWWERLRPDARDAALEWHPVGETRLPLRALPPETPKPPGTHRTLFLGDSFTYGVGLPEEDTFVHRTVERLKASPPLPDVARYEGFNGGIPGSLPREWRILLDHLGPSLAPDLVLAVFFVRDGVPGLTTSQPIDAVRDEMQRLQETSWAYRHLALYRLLRTRIERRRLSDRYLERLRRGYLGEPPAARIGWIRAQRDLLWLRARSRRLGASFGLVIFPMLYELGRSHPLEEVYAEIERFATENDITVMSLLPAFRGRHGPDLWISAYDQHPNARGHAIAADALHPFVATLIRSRSTPSPTSRTEPIRTGVSSRAEPAAAAGPG